MKSVLLRGLATGILAAFTVVISLHAQEIKLGKSHDIQIHGFGSQSFIYTDDNNWLTMDTSAGSFKFTDVGLNMGTQVSSNFRIAAQGYDREL
ncbi:MAG TPA: hypothetical protein VGF01_00425, partial [Terracidiphilus sp.]